MRQADEAEKTYESTMAAAHGEARQLLAETLGEERHDPLPEQTKEASIAVSNAQIRTGRDAASRRRKRKPLCTASVK